MTEKAEVKQRDHDATFRVDLVPCRNALSHNQAQW
jgi:hypothetical protein